MKNEINISELTRYQALDLEGQILGFPAVIPGTDNFAIVMFDIEEGYKMANAIRTLIACMPEKEMEAFTGETLFYLNEIQRHFSVNPMDVVKQFQKQ